MSNVAAKPTASKHVPLRERAVQLRCANCGAKPGEACRGVRGPLKTVTHADRRHAARCLIAAERTAAMAVVGLRRFYQRELGTALEHEDLVRILECFVQLTNTHAPDDDQLLCDVHTDVLASLERMRERTYLVERFDPPRRKAERAPVRDGNVIDAFGWLRERLRERSRA